MDNITTIEELPRMSRKKNNPQIDKSIKKSSDKTIHFRNENDRK